MKKIALALTLLLAFPVVLYAQDTKKEAPKVEVKAPASQPAPAPAVAAPASQPAKAAASAPAAAQVAPAPDAEAGLPWWKVLLKYILELVFTILGVLASVFVTVLMKKYGFEDYATKVNDLLARGTGYAEQKSLQALKLNQAPLKSSEKLALALEFITEKAKEYKLPDKGKAWWEKKVEGWLGVQNMATSNGTSKPNG